MARVEIIASPQSRVATRRRARPPDPPDADLSNGEPARRILIIDRRAVMGTEICRTLGRRGWTVDVAGERFSPAFLSRWRSRAFISPGLHPSGRFLQFIASIVENNHYDGIFVCNEEVLDCLLDLPRGTAWKGLPLSSPDSLRIALSRHRSGRLAAQCGLDIPRTVTPSSAAEVESFGADLGYPLLVKGDRGEAGGHVRLVSDASRLPGAYREIMELERGAAEPPVLQEFINGPAYSVGGLYDHGRPLRVCAHRKLVGVPPLGGLTAKGVTEKVPGLLEATFKVFAALNYTGLGHAEFIRDRSSRFRFLEVNPRVWGTVAVSGYAGVDLFGAYLDLARGRAVEPNLEFREGVVFHRLLREARLLRKSPSALFRIVKDCFDPAVRSDFEWSDPLTHLAAFLPRGASRRERKGALNP